MTWKLVIHGGAGAMRPGTAIAEHEERARAGLDATRSTPARRSWRTAAARSTRSRRRCGCWRTTPASTPGAEACSPLTAMSSSTRRSWTAATAAPARSPGCARPARRSACARTVMEQGPHVLLTYEGADRFAREARARAGRQRLVRDRPSAGASSTNCSAEGGVRRRHQIWNDRRGRGRCVTAMSPPPPRPAD